MTMLLTAMKSEQDLLHRLNPALIPKHIAIIMDGNGRWAKQRHMPRIFGHRAGIASVRDIVQRLRRDQRQSSYALCFLC